MNINERVIKLTKQLWGQLTKQEREDWYHGDGALGFIENVVFNILHLNEMPLTDEEADDLLDALFEIDE